MKKTETFRLVLAAVLIAIGIVLFFFSFTINLFGVPAVRVDFITVPILIAGFLLGKWYGLAVGTLVDLIGYFSASAPVGAYFFGFTLNLALVGFAAGFLPQILHKVSPRLTQISMIVLLTTSVSAAITYIAVTPSIPLGTDVIDLNNGTKIALIASIVVLTFLSIFFFNLILRETRFTTNNMQKIIITMLVSELVLIILTPIWVYMLYENPPIFVGVISRLVRASFIFPVKVIAVLAVLNAVKQQETFNIEVLS
jgi:ECF transporter S component (folate family)